jgi:hypothetical protein
VRILTKINSWLLVLLLAVSVVNYPNPFNPLAGQVTTIECSSDTTREASLYIYDMAARLLKRQDLTLQGGSTVRYVWDGFSDYNELSGNGIYLYQIIGARKRLARGKIWVVNQ